MTKRRQIKNFKLQWVKQWTPGERATHRLDQREDKTGKVDELGQLYNAKLISKQEENIYDLYYTMKRQNL